MPAMSLDRDLQEFTIELFERGGGAADWPRPDVPGTVVISPELAKAASLPGEEFPVGTAAAAGALHVGLAGEFLDIAGHVLEVAIPHDGSFCIPERYLTSRDLTAKIGQTFGWQNARAKCSSAEPALVEYHLWTLVGSLKSEDVWEAVYHIGVNAESLAVVELPDVLHEPDLIADAHPSDADEPATYAVAIAEGKRRLQTASAAFVSRIEQRLTRDRKRLEQYYHALAREADGPKRRAATALSPDEIAAKKRAVSLELRRKLAELTENHALRAALRPVVVARVRLPALVVPVVIQRKQAVRDYLLYWNSLSKKFEPLSCSRCRRPTFSATFTNEDVDLLCAACAADK